MLAAFHVLTAGLAFASQALAVSPQSPPGAPRAQSRSATPVHPSLDLTIQGAVVAPLAVDHGVPAPLSPGWYGISLDMPNYPVPELCVAGIPDPAVAGPGDRPLLVVFHQFNASHGDVLEHTEFDTEAMARGWYLLGPLSRSPVGNPGINYGSIESQEFTERSLEWMLKTYPIDRSRVYGVGFSMGAAQLMAYASRHRDPKRGQFAALVNHTGSVDQADTWLSNPAARPLLELIFGGPPALATQAYRQASAIELDPMTGSLLTQGTHLARNLAHVPVQMWWATLDPNPYLVQQTIQCADLLLNLPGSTVDLHPVASTKHRWDTMPAGEVCSWLEAQTLQVATAGQLIADRDGRWSHFDLVVESSGFASFDYSIDLSASIVTVSQSQGLTQLSTDLADWEQGTPFLPLIVNCDALDSGDILVFEGIPTAPMQVTRDGVPNSAGWTYDATSQTLTLTETETGPHVWAFLP